MFEWNKVFEWNKCLNVFFFFFFFFSLRLNTKGGHDSCFFSFLPFLIKLERRCRCYNYTVVVTDMCLDMRCYVVYVKWNGTSNKCLNVGVAACCCCERAIIVRCACVRVVVIIRHKLVVYCDTVSH